jgi:hypothetical protein
MVDTLVLLVFDPLTGKTFSSWSCATYAWCPILVLLACDEMDLQDIQKLELRH